MKNATPFFKCFGPLLFGKPPVSALSEALSKLSECSSLAQLSKSFGSYIPQSYLAPIRRGNNSRRRIFSLEVVFWSFFDQVQTPNSSCRETVRKVMALVRSKFPNQKALSMSPDTSAYCQARAKIPLDVMDKINTHLVDRLQSHIPQDTLWHGRNVMLVDGTGISMPDTAANQAIWPQSKNQTIGCGFPLMNLVGIFSLLSGALVKVAHGNRHTHESLLFRTLWSSLKKGDLVVADRGFCSYSTFVNLLAREVDSLMRLPEKQSRKALGSLLPKTESFDVILDWKRPKQCPQSMTPEEFAILPQSLPVRVIRYTIAQRGFRTQTVTLVTTLLDEAIPESDLAEIYFRRWAVELHFREIKTHLNMDILRCQSPKMIERELRMHFIAYNLIRCVMQQSALTHNIDLNRISFKGCLDTVRQFANATSAVDKKPKTISSLVDQMLLSIAQDQNPFRPGRSEPRTRKRRPKNYRLLTRPRHQIDPLSHQKVRTENPPKSPLT